MQFHTAFAKEIELKSFPIKLIINKFLMDSVLVCPPSPPLPPPPTKKNQNKTRTSVMERSLPFRKL